MGMCLARNHGCSICNKLNHFFSACLSSQTQTSRSGQRGDRSQQPDRQLPPKRGRNPRREASLPPRGHLRHLHGIRVRGLSARRTPQVDIEVQHACEQGVISWIRDSGAEVCAMSINQARCIGMNTNNLSPPPDRLFGQLDKNWTAEERSSAHSDWVQRPHRPSPSASSRTSPAPCCHGTDASSSVFYLPTFRSR